MTEPNTPEATRHAFESGLDVVFQSQYGQQRPYLDAFQRGLIPLPVIDAAVARVLRAKFEIGLFEHPYVDADAAAAANGSVEHLALARAAAAASMVLLRNERGTLPLAKTLPSLAVIGVDAEEGRLGGYSGPGVRKISMLDGLRATLGAARVNYAPGPGRLVTTAVTVPADALSSPGANGASVRGLAAEDFDNNRFDGAPRLTRTDPRIDFRWTLNSPGRGIPFDWYSARWTGTITAPASGVARIGVEGNDGYRLYLDGTMKIDNWIKKSYGTTLIDAAWAPGSTHQIRLEYFESTGNARLKLVWDAGVADDSAVKIDDAVALARKSAAAIVVAGVEEGEFRDRAYLKLPGAQEELIRRVAATGTPTIVVIVGGSAVTMSAWIEQADAIVDACTRASRAARPWLTFFSAMRIRPGDCRSRSRCRGQLPLWYNHKPTGRGDDYVDLTGMPLFPFGFGLSYSTFEVLGPADCTGGDRAGGRRDDSLAGSAIPGRAPATKSCSSTSARRARHRGAAGHGTQGIHAGRTGPRHSTEITFTIGADALRMLDRDMRWVVNRQLRHDRGDVEGTSGSAAS